ncbi:MAG: hypothetical protein B1H04_06720 [Planctomycetales bacterium 4484_123]|nr:MAG: hypothetical protein B1H04_06720 [Planctomycetales bacterium 4484_123]
MKSAITTVCLLAGWTALTGCGQQTPVSAIPRTGGEANFDIAWEAALETLREYRFRIDRADRRAGIITTYPMTGRYWFEFWRADAATDRDVLEGSLQTIYRTVTVRLRRKAPPATGPTTTSRPAECFAEVTVHTARSDRPTPQITSASEAFEMFLAPHRPSSEARGGPVPGTGANVVQLGKDPALAGQIQLRINSRIAKALSIYPRPDTSP